MVKLHQDIIRVAASTVPKIDQEYSHASGAGSYSHFFIINPKRAKNHHDPDIEIELSML